MLELGFEPWLAMWAWAPYVHGFTAVLWASAKAVFNLESLYSDKGCRHSLQIHIYYVVVEIEECMADGI